MRARTAQLPCPPEGADRVIVTRDAVIVLDGASAFAPLPISPAAYADHLGTAIAAGLDASPGAPLAAILASAIRRTAETLGLRDDSGPSSTVAIARDGRIRFVVMGECDWSDARSRSWLDELLGKRD